MAYTQEFDKHAHFGDLFELTVEAAAELLQSGLWDSEQASVAEIHKALIAAIMSGDLELVRGSVGVVGKYSANPAILDAFKAAAWAERYGLELESNGNFDSYMHDELEIQQALLDKLSALRDIEATGKSRVELLKEFNATEGAEDKFISLIVENSRLREQLRASNSESRPPKDNPKTVSSLLKIVHALAIEAYRYDSTVAKSDVPREIAEAVKDRLGVSIDEDTTRRWLREAASAFPKRATGKA